MTRTRTRSTIRTRRTIRFLEIRIRFLEPRRFRGVRVHADGGGESTLAGGPRGSRATEDVVALGTSAATTVVVVVVGSGVVEGEGSGTDGSDGEGALLVGEEVVVALRGGEGREGRGIGQERENTAPSRRGFDPQRASSGTRSTRRRGFPRAYQRGEFPLHLGVGVEVAIGDGRRRHRAPRRNLGVNDARADLTEHHGRRRSSSTLVLSNGRARARATRRAPSRC